MIHLLMIIKSIDVDAIINQELFYNLVFVIFPICIIIFQSKCPCKIWEIQQRSTI